MIRRWRWSCALCPAHGRTDNRDAAVSGWAWHYQQQHREAGVAGQDSYARAILRAVETGACDARPDLTDSSTSTAPKEHRLMPKTTYPAHVCTVLRAVSHTGGAR